MVVKSKGIPLISGKSRLVKWYNLARRYSNGAPGWHHIPPNDDVPGASNKQENPPRHFRFQVGESNGIILGPETQEDSMVF